MKKMIFLAMFLTIFPIDVFIKTGYVIQEIDISYFIAEVIGYILYNIYFQQYTRNQKRLLVVAIIFSCISYFTITMQWILDMNVNEWKTNTMSDMGPYIIDVVLFFSAYLGKILISLILGVSILRKKNNIN